MSAVNIVARSKERSATTWTCQDLQWIVVWSTSNRKNLQTTETAHFFDTVSLLSQPIFHPANQDFCSGVNMYAFWGGRMKRNVLHNFMIISTSILQIHIIWNINTCIRYKLVYCSELHIATYCIELCAYESVGGALCSRAQYGTLVPHVKIPSEGICDL